MSSTLNRFTSNLFPFLKKHRGKIGLGAAAVAAGTWGTTFEETAEQRKTIRRFTEKKFGQVANKLWDIDTSNELPEELKERTDESAREFRILTRALKKYGQKVGTGHKRIVIPKSILNIEEMEEDLGFIPVTVAVPEAGQTKFETWRHPDMKYHLHEHGEVFTMHLDRHEASTMIIKRAEIQKKDLSITQKANLFWEGLPHVVTEGIPGAYYYMKGQLSGSDDMLSRLEKEQDPEYSKLLLGLNAAQQNGMSFSGKDDFYNTIEGLPHGGMSEAMRRALTDFGSGWIRAALKKGISPEKIARSAFKLGMGGAATEQAFVAGVKGQFSRGAGRGVRYMRQVAAEKIIPVSEVGKGVTSFRMGEVFGGGGMGVVRRATIMRTGEKAVYKTAREGSTGTIAGALVGGGAGGVTHAVERIQRAQKIASSVGMQKQLGEAVKQHGLGPSALEDAVKTFKPLAEETRAFAMTATETMQVKAARAGGITDPLKWEAFVQKEAKLKIPQSVPEMLGESRTGFFQEHAGRAITKKEMPDAVTWARRQFKQLMSGERGVVHLDPHMGQVTIHPEKGYQIVDWGLAAPITGHAPDKIANATQMLDYNMRKALGGSTALRNQSKVMDAQDAAESFMEIHKNEIIRKQTARVRVPKPMGGPTFAMPGAAPRMPGALPNPTEKAARITNNDLTRPDGFAAKQLRKKNTEFSSPVDLNRAASGDISSLPKVARPANRSILEPNRQKQRRKEVMQKKHRQAQVHSSSNAVRPGRRHRQQTGRIVN